MNFAEIVNALPRSDEVVRISVGAVIGSCIIGFIIGLALTAVLCFYYIKHQSKPRIPSNPHYITKQNSYVTVPMKEVKYSFLLFVFFKLILNL